MFKLIGTMNNNGVLLFAIQDTSDFKIDVVEEPMVMSFLKVGLKIGGINPLPDFSDFEYTDEYFIPMSTDTDIDDSEDIEDDSDYDEDSEYEDYDEDDSDDIEDDYVGDYDEDDYYEDAYEKEESTVSKLYSHLTPEQIKTLQMYYLWYSQNIFNAAQKDPTLNMKSDRARARKQAELGQLRNEGGLWHYAGFIDTGYDGGGYCTLGHKLRYMHLAWDVTVSDIETAFWGNDYTNKLEEILDSNNVIIFGIKCITDFFEVDQECMSNLLRAQRESMKEMDMMCQVYETNKFDEYKNDFKLFEEVMTILAKKNAKAKMAGLEPPIREGLIQFYLKFKEVGMIYPKSLVQSVRDELVGWKDHKFIGDRFIKNTDIQKSLVKIIGKRANSMFDLYNSSYDFDPEYVSSRYISVLRQYFELFFYREIAGVYRYDPYSKLCKDEGGGAQRRKDWLDSRQRYIKSSFFSDAEYSLDFVNKIFELCITIKYWRERFKEVAKMYDIEFQSEDGLYHVKEQNYTRYNTATYSQREYFPEIFGDCFTEVDSGKPINFKKGITIDECIEENKKFLDLVNTEGIIEFEKSKKMAEEYAEKKNAPIIERRKREEEEKRLRKEAEEKLREAERQKEQELKEEEEKSKSVNETSSESGKTRDEILQYCLSAIQVKANAEKIKSANEFYLKVLQTVSKTGSASDKQMYYISKAYETLTNDKVKLVSADKKSLAEHQEIALDIAKVQEKEEELRKIQGEESADKTMNILASILKWGSASEKQLRWLERAKKDLGI